MHLHVANQWTGDDPEHALEITGVQPIHRDQSKLAERDRTHTQKRSPSVTAEIPPGDFQGAEAHCSNIFY
jgi:hypothetical protein